MEPVTKTAVQTDKQTAIYNSAMEPVSRTDIQTDKQTAVGYNPAIEPVS